MHDHSRFQLDIDDVTGVSLSLSLSLSLSQKSLTHNIGSASALPIIHNMIDFRVISANRQLIDESTFTLRVGL